ncbi:MAG: FkbM family methyltransferase, partial [Clostridia bacterium]|nr:FkbM family methyltransferase [Clostridia bacterium]
MIENILNRESVWEKLEHSEKPVVLYGMGNGADMILDEFATLGIKCSGVFASDDFVRGQSFRGFKVEKLSDIEARLDDFTVAVGFATSLDSVIENIIEISKHHSLLVPCVPVCGKDIVNRDFILKNCAEIEEAYSLLYDEESKNVFENSLRYMFSGELDILLGTISAKADAFSSFFKLNSLENYLDLGAYRGDTVAEFLRFTGGKYSSITAVEPDTKTFAKLEKFCKEIAACTCVNACVSDTDGLVNFNNSAGRQSSISTNGKEIKSLTVDTICEGRGVTYLKAD